MPDGWCLLCKSRDCGSAEGKSCYRQPQWSKWNGKKQKNNSAYMNRVFFFCPVWTAGLLAERFTNVKVKVFLCFCGITECNQIWWRWVGRLASFSALVYLSHIAQVCSFTWKGQHRYVEQSCQWCPFSGWPSGPTPFSSWPARWCPPRLNFSSPVDRCWPKENQRKGEDNSIPMTLIYSLWPHIV